jgi:hypothetical protein
MQRFKSTEQAQRFLETFSAVCNHFRPRRHRLSAGCYRQIMRERSQQWREIAELTATASKRRDRPTTASSSTSAPVFQAGPTLNLSMPTLIGHAVSAAAYGRGRQRPQPAATLLR